MQTQLRATEWAEITEEVRVLEAVIHSNGEHLHFLRHPPAHVCGAHCWEDEDFLAFLDINPVNAGHTLVVPKRHIDCVFDLPEPLYSALFRVSKQLSQPLQAAMQSQRIGLVIEGFSVPHVHVHLVPINNGNELNPERARRASHRELEDVAIQIRSQINS